MPRQFLTICLIVALACPVLCGPEKAKFPSGSTQAKKAAEQTGPTVYLDYESDESRDNSVASFMYFVPMISKVLVESKSSTHNTQKARIVSSSRKSDGDKFELESEFVMRGKGWHINRFDPQDIVAKDTDDVPQEKPLKNIIEYIKFEGGGHGKIEVRGERIGGAETVTNVKVIFNHSDNTSPVTIGLYSMKPQDGQYRFENRYATKKARVNSISFSAEDQRNPKMDIEIASLGARDAQEGLYSRIKGKIANLFIPAVPIAPAGNRAMLDFGHSLYTKQATFTFPRAKNLKPATQNIQEPILAKAETTQRVKTN